jgi:hypothetical protein
MLSRGLLIALVTVGVQVGCGSRDRPPVIDAGGDTLPNPDVGSDTEPAMPAVDFTVSGCASFDASVPSCRGPAPLTLSFIPITSGNVSRFLWDFGDLSAPSSEMLASHTYPLPGMYTVTLTGAPGQVWARHDDIVVVTANAFGEACDLDRQCETGLQCLCGLSASCPAAFARGMCSQACGTSACPETGICADLALGTTPGGPSDPWRDKHCLRRCTGAADCPAGQGCRLVPSAAAPERWEKACFQGFPGDLGAACRGAGGEPQHQQCLGGLCADLGALGACSVDCSARPCPEGLGCAAFNDGRRLCLRPCPESPCLEDPLQGCVAPGPPATSTFNVAGAMPDQKFCAPRACTADSDCAPAGICRGLPGPGHCVRG